MKQYVGFIRDHSMSMSGLGPRAMDDYNILGNSFKRAATDSSIQTLMTTVLCGIGPGKGLVKVDNLHVPIEHFYHIYNYPTNGYSTPLFDSVGELIDLFRRVPDYYDKNTSFLIMSVTDGGDNDSPRWRHRIANEIQELQRTDRWSFVFRVPKGYKSVLTQYGIPSQNILEWEQTEESLKQSTVSTDQGVGAYYKLRSSGVGSTQTFYANAPTKAEVKAALNSIAKEASVYPNVVREGASIKEVAEHYTGKYVKGTVFYHLLRRESRVQDYKLICVQEKNTRNIYAGRAARDLLGIPHQGTIALAPGKHGDYDIFVQSTSLNRKIPKDSKVLVWMNVRNM